MAKAKQSKTKHSILKGSIIMDDQIWNWRKLNLESMDIILCAGNSRLSKRIKQFQRLTGVIGKVADLTHVAGISRYLANVGKLQLQESTTLNKYNSKSGVQENNFERWLENYDGKVYVKQLLFDRTSDFYFTDDYFWNDHKDEPYENGIPGGIELLLCGLRLHRYVRKLPFMGNYKPKFTKAPHCTELQAKRLLAHKLWKIPIFINRMPPWIWWSQANHWLKVPVLTNKRIK